ncbi:MAG: site-2 protease family protein [Bacteroidia bacterium]
MLRNPRLLPVLQIGLACVTAFTVLLAGAEMRTGRSVFGDLSRAEWWAGLPYMLALLAFITVHEFGHYFTARYHRVRATLPFYIPLYIPGFFNIGTLGAVIMLRETPGSTRKFFDIGIAGPLAGFVVALGLLIYGFATLPDLETYVMAIHPEYEEVFCGVPGVEEMRAFQQANGSPGLWMGSNLMYILLARVIPADPSQVPPPFEMMHYPLLFTGYLTLFFTALNLLPAGQLDGGHVVYGMFGRKTAGILARITVGGLLLFGGTGLVDVGYPAPSNIVVWVLYFWLLVYLSGQIFGRRRRTLRWGVALGFLVLQGLLKGVFPAWEAQGIWVLYSLLLTRVVRLDHPPAYFEHRVNRSRQWLGWLAIAIFVLSFTPAPLRMEGLLQTDWRGEWQLLAGWLGLG